MRGLIAGGVTGTTAWTFPSGYRPTITTNIPTVASTSTSGVTYLPVSAVGAVQPTYPGTLTFMIIDSLTFVVD
jgi:hypothetical protein